ncbi:GPO family capsid scaffolding protein [Iodobacter sp.]|uniref:GPO family capsid scaffolding protein n=1 Tax=Iodobacter sp. TaxID=1915058 RepID=UPI0025EC9EA6|nr:GPO family capsid scaffolding protein [Iodobacter sp.]
MAKSKFFRVATEGATTDGRKIDRTWIEQMAANYNPAKFGARVNMEHIKGVLPDGPFKAYGDVIAVEARKVEDNKMALFAQIDPTSDLIAMNKTRQKVFTSIEVDPSFAGTGQAYLVALAVTDNPASLGCEMLQFSSTAGTGNPLASRKQNPENLFTAAEEFKLELEEESTNTNGEGLFSKVKNLLNFKGKQDESRFSDIGQAVEALAESQRDVLQEHASMSTSIKGLRDRLDLAIAAQDSAVSDFNGLKTQLGKTDANFNQRPPAQGGGSVVLTDC